MAVDGQLTLFGLDLRKVPQVWRAGWQELLWAPNAYCRKWVDETVTAVFPNEGRRSYLAGKEVALSKTKSKAYILPEELVLDMRLDLPASVEDHLESMLALEVRTRSPFPENDTRYGWHARRLSSGNLQVELVIVSHRLVTQHLQVRDAELFDGEDGWLQEHLIEIDEEDRSWLRGKVDEEELWAIVNDQSVVIQGYGEAARDQRYHNRMKRVIAGLLYSFLMVCALVGVMMVFKYWQMQALEAEYVQVQESAAEAVELRSSLAEQNARVSGINKLIAGSYNPHPQISKLSEVLADDTWLASMNIKGNTMRLNGRAENATALMESLSNRSEFSEVAAPTAITSARGQGERFVFDITLNPIEVKEIEMTIPSSIEPTLQGDEQEATSGDEAEKEIEELALGNEEEKNFLGEESLPEELSE